MPRNVVTITSQPRGGKNLTLDSKSITEEVQERR
jgi:hypothetical protein